MYRDRTRHSESGNRQTSNRYLVLDLPPSILWRAPSNSYGRTILIEQGKTPPPSCSPRDLPSADKKAQGQRPKAPQEVLADSPPIYPVEPI